MRAGERIARACEVAYEANGWNIVEIGQKAEADPSAGTVPYGFARFHRIRLEDDIAYGTAMWVEHDGRITFQTGHYDMSRAESIKDYSERMDP